MTLGQGTPRYMPPEVMEGMTDDGAEGRYDAAAWDV